MKGCIGTPAIQIREKLLHKLVDSNVGDSWDIPGYFRHFISAFFGHIWDIL